MADRDYRWSNDQRGSGRRQQGDDRDFYGRTSYSDDDYGTGYGEEGYTNYARRNVQPYPQQQRGRGPERYGDTQRSFGSHDPDPYYSGSVGRGGFGSGSGYRGESWGRGLDDDYGRSYYGSRDPGYGGGGYGSREYGQRSYEADRRSDYGRGGRGQEERGWWDRASDEVQSWFGDDDAERRRARDSREDARHSGRGPKGYKRSDERIREDVSDRLTDDAFIDASEIDIEVSGSEVTLNGSVDSRMSRRRAEDIAERVSGVTHVQNNLRVSSGSETTREEREAIAAGRLSSTTTTNKL